MPSSPRPHSRLTSNLRIDGERLWGSLMAMAQIGATTRGGCNRQALTAVDKEGRDLFVSWCKGAGCAIEIDQIGNIFARRPGREPESAPVLIASHLDTQPTGGRFDGVYGVLAGLEVVRTLNDAGISTRRPIVVASWTNEEGARFAPAMLGSGVFAGAHDLDYAYSRADRDRVTVQEALAAIGYLGVAPVGGRPFSAAFEVHIEQGPILEASGDLIGVVTGVQGCFWFDLVLTGSAAHAGSTPMEMRRDPWRAALPILETAFAIAEARAPFGRCTIGDLAVEPGSRNTVPERLKIAIDLRHPEADILAVMHAELEAEVVRACAERRIDGKLEEIWRMPPTNFAPALVDEVEAAAQALGLPSRRMVSGAGHDSLHLASVAPTAMIFVPCADGVSHNEAESAEPAHLAAGADVLLQTVLAAADAP
jgi:N-carbamoyl-L-amino-acid hydrolase